MTRIKKSRKVNTNGPARPPREKKQAEAKAKRKIGKGLATGNRHSGEAVKSGKPADNTAAKDPRLGSKKKIALVVEGPQSAPSQPRLSPEKELARLENSPRLSLLLDKVEGGELLAAADQFWLDTTLARIAILMDELGIDDDFAEEAPVSPPSVVAESAASELDMFERFEQGSDLLEQYKS
ncbi:MAG: Der GTPase-activating protein YihI [Ferrimonas sp.]